MDNLSLHKVVDEPGRCIVMAEARSVVHRNGDLYADYHYYGRRNDGPWVDLQPIGNRIPADW